jgi:transcriptional regulator with XRE-family HTH domain
MPATELTTSGANLRPVTNEDRGREITRRRLALGLNNVSQFAEATGRDRQTITRVEQGVASDQTYDWIEAWLTRIEEETGLDEPTPVAASPIRVTFHDVTTSSIGEIIVEGPSDQPDELIATIARLLSEVRKGTGE